MGLDNLKLSPFLVKKLYENSLTGIGVHTAEPAAITNPATAKKTATAGAAGQTRFLGENKKNILVTVSDKQHSFAADEDLEFLVNVLRACNISMGDIALVNCFENASAHYEKINAQFSPAVILFLGTEPQLLGFPVQIPQYRVQHYNNQQYLCAPALQKISADKEAKKELWTALKQIFSIP